ncbi:DUF7109 family protein [Halobacterium litoreum]|uniref:Uncharacterized protein n=1 Tax=Halobacterium litoreum TaxID=2039234 RepID=A0ABD5NGJ3_9EURY|nr:hypothetical protein [Halobacterium litoreum]UHH12762.1 hypothetical protein LT972_11400 [Halobacterium litoreum]
MDGDELAGVVDLFGGLTRAELDDAVDELAFKRGEEADGVEADVENALRDYYLVEVDREDETVLAPGPAAFPSPPEYATDLPHILDVERREISRDALADAVRARLEADAADAEPGSERARSLVDATYDAEAWAPVDLGDVRAELTDDA